jgi:hypothetical protein
MDPNEKPAPEKNLRIMLAAVGAAAWVAPWLLLGRKEAWDHWSYFAVSIPVMCAAAAYAGYVAKARSWRWPLALALGQLAAALVLNGFGNLLPLGVIVFAILSVPMLIAAAVGAWLGRRRDRLPEASR